MLELSPQVFAILSALIEERFGLHYGPADRELLAEKVSPRAMAIGFDSLLDYYYYLRYDAAAGQEYDALAEALVVGETYLFRELDQLEALVEDVLVPQVANGRRPRVWSAACATGEEPLSLAMLLAQRGLLDRVDLVASDLSARALARAHEGKYGRRAVRSEEARRLAAPWIEELADGRIRVVPELRAAITWRRVNLTRPDEISAQGVFDAILCRNVLIYFNDQGAANVVRSLTEQLVPEGVLLVGVSESLLRLGAPLVCEEHRGVFLYRKQ